jgi:hypothetical protein
MKNKKNVNYFLKTASVLLIILMMTSTSFFVTADIISTEPKMVENQDLEIEKQQSSELLKKEVSTFYDDYETQQSEDSLIDQIRSVFNEMDLSVFPSGILLDYGTVFSREVILRSNGQQTDNPLEISRDVFIEAYGELTRSSLEVTFPSVKELLTINQETLETKQHTPLSLLGITYDVLDEQAFTDKRISPNNDILKRVSNNDVLFSTHAFFAASPLATAVYGPNNEFIIPSSLVITNDRQPVRFDELSITFENTANPISVFVDVPFTVDSLTSDEDGLVHFCVSGLANNEKFFTYGVFKYRNMQMPEHYDIKSVTATIPYMYSISLPSGSTWDFPLYGKVNLRIYPSTGTVIQTSGGLLPTFDIKLKNIMFIVDGFDLTNSRTQNTIWEDFQVGMQMFLDMGFDIISIDYAGNCGNTFVQANGNAIREVFKKIPTWMAPGFENRRAVVASGSMGTQTARYALTTAENDYEDHHVGLFIAIDGPFKGSNIPVGLQNALYFLASENKLDNAAAKGMWDGLNSVAAKQLLLHRRDYCPDALFYEYYSEVDGLGLPKTCRNVGVASGSGSGKRFSDEPVIEFTNFEGRYKVGIEDIPLGKLGTVQRFVKVVGHLKTYSDNDGVVFDGLAEVFALVGGVYIKIKTYDHSFSIDETTYGAGARYIDLAPGGYRESAQQFTDAFNKGAKDPTMTYDLGIHCYMPTYTALAIDPSSINYDINYAPGNDLDLYSKTPFDAVYFEPVDNIGHVYPSEGNLEFLRNELSAFMATQHSAYLAYTEDGIYQIKDNGNLIRRYWDDNQWQTEVITNDGPALMQRSLLKGFPYVIHPAKTIYGVNKNGNLFHTNKNQNGDIILTNHEEMVICSTMQCGYVDIAPGSLVLGDPVNINQGENKAPGIYATSGKYDRNGWGIGVTNFNFQGFSFSARGTTTGSPSPGSLVYGDNNIYGVDISGCICLVRQENQNLAYYKILEDRTDIVPGSLCYGHSTGGPGTAHGLFAVTLDGRVVNYRWTQNGWSRRTTPWGTVIAGSLMYADAVIYGVDSSGCLCLIREEGDGTLHYYKILDDKKDVVAGSLCWFESQEADQQQSIFAVTNQGKIVDYRWVDTQWVRREPCWGGDAIPGSLVFGDNKIFGIKRHDTMIAAWPDGNCINYSILDEDSSYTYPTPPIIKGRPSWLVNTPITFSIGGSQDVGNEELQYTINWGDGSAEQTWYAWPGVFNRLTHIYSQATWLYTITVTVKKLSTGAVAQNTFTLLVHSEGTPWFSYDFLTSGWNYKSFRIVSEDMSMESIMQPLIDLGDLVMVTDGEGGVFNPGQGINTIGDMDVTKGYMIKVTQDTWLQIEGKPASLPQDILLKNGSNLIGYPVNEQRNALAVVQPLITEGVLIEVIDINNAKIYYNGQEWINDIGDFTPGGVYVVKVNQLSVLTILKDQTPPVMSWTDTEVVSTESTSDSQYITLFVDSYGTVHAAWEDKTNYNGCGSDYDIFYKYKTFDGTWSTPEVVSTESTQWSEKPSLVVDSSGIVHIAWQDSTNYNGCGSDYDIFYKYKDSNGDWSMTEVVSTESTMGSQYPSLFVDTQGKIHVAWEDQTNYNGCGSDWDIFYKNKPTNEAWSITEVVSTESTSPSRSASLFMDAQGTIHVAWKDLTDYNGCGSDWDIFYKNKPTNEAWSITEVVSTESQQTSGDPCLFVDLMGILHLTWTEGEGSVGVILYTHKSLEKSWITTEVVSTESTSRSGYSSLFVDTQGSIHVAWADLTDYNGCGSDFDIFYKSKALNEDWPTSTEIVSTESTMHSFYPSLFVDSMGVIHIAWNDQTDYNNCGSDRDIFYKQKTIIRQYPTTPKINGPGLWEVYENPLFYIGGADYPEWTYLQYTIDWGDGSTQEFWEYPSLYQSFQHAWTKPGTYLITVTAYNPDTGNEVSATHPVIVFKSPQAETTTLELSAGWNWVSFNVIPEGVSMRGIIQPLIEFGVLEIVQDGGVNVLWPAYGIDTIGDMDVTKGYKVKVSQDAVLDVTGTRVALPSTIPLQAGWNLIGYPVNEPRNALSVIQPLIDNGMLIQVLDESNAKIYYNGQQWVNNIGDFEPGQGYYIKVNQETALEIIQEQPPLYPTPPIINGEDSWPVNQNAVFTIGGSEYPEWVDLHYIINWGDNSTDEFWLKPTMWKYLNNKWTTPGNYLIIATVYHPDTGYAVSTTHPITIYT